MPSGHGPPPRSSSASDTLPRTAEAGEAAEAEGEAVEADAGDVVVSTGPAAGHKDLRLRVSTTTTGRVGPVIKSALFFKIFHLKKNLRGFLQNFLSFSQMFNGFWVEPSV